MSVPSLSVSQLAPLLPRVHSSAGVESVNALADVEAMFVSRQDEFIKAEGYGQSQRRRDATSAMQCRAT